MNSIKHTTLLFLIGYSLFGCTPSTSSTETEAPTASPLRQGLWVPETSTEPNPLAWIVNETAQELTMIEGDFYSGTHALKANTAGDWQVMSRQEVFSFEGKALSVATKSETSRYRSLLEKTAFHWKVDSLTDLEQLLSLTGNWQEANSKKTIVFYTPICSIKLDTTTRSFKKEALVFEKLPEDRSVPSLNRERIAFHYHAGILYLLMNRQKSTLLQRYAIVSTTPNKWLLRSLSPPYASVTWNRVTSSPAPLQELLENHNQRLEKEQQLGLVDCLD